jgi:hypothetical protein
MEKDPTILTVLKQQIPEPRLQSIKSDLLDHLFYTQGKLPEMATRNDWYMALARVFTIRLFPARSFLRQLCAAPFKLRKFTVRKADPVPRSYCRFQVAAGDRLQKFSQMLTSNTELANKLDELEKKYDRQFKMVFYAIRQLMTPPTSKRKQIGFRPKALQK